MHQRAGPAPQFSVAAAVSFAGGGRNPMGSLCGVVSVDLIGVTKRIDWVLQGWPGDADILMDW